MPLDANEREHNDGERHPELRIIKTLIRPSYKVTKHALVEAISIPLEAFHRKGYEDRRKSPFLPRSIRQLIILLLSK